MLFEFKPKKFYVHIHLEYAPNDTVRYIHLPLSNRYEEINTILSYLQNEQNIPIYCTDVRMSTADSIDTEDFYKITFEGDVQSFV